MPGGQVQDEDPKSTLCCVCRRQTGPIALSSSCVAAPRSPLPTRRMSMMHPSHPAEALRCSSTAWPSCGAPGVARCTIVVLLENTTHGMQADKHALKEPRLVDRAGSAADSMLLPSCSPGHAAATPCHLRPSSHLRTDAGQSHHPDARCKDHPGSVAQPGPQRHGQGEQQEEGANAQQHRLLHVLGRAHLPLSVQIEAGLDEQRPAARSQEQAVRINGGRVEGSCGKTHPTCKAPGHPAPDACTARWARGEQALARRRGNRRRQLT